MKVCVCFEWFENDTYVFIPTTMMAVGTSDNVTKQNYYHPDMQRSRSLKYIGTRYRQRSLKPPHRKCLWLSVKMRTENR